jgi:hypothetical protein
LRSRAGRDIHNERRPPTELIGPVVGKLHGRYAVLPVKPRLSVAARALWCDDHKPLLPSATALEFALIRL